MKTDSELNTVNKFILVKSIVTSESFILISIG